MKYHKINIVFTSPVSWFSPYSWAIKLVQGWSTASHVAIQFTSPTGIPMVYQASGSMNNYMALHRFKKKSKIEKSFEIEITDLQYNMLMWRFDMMAGTPYSFLQALGVIFKDILGHNPFKNGRRASICTEVVARELIDMGYDIRRIESLSPYKLYKVLKAEHGNS